MLNMNCNMGGLKVQGLGVRDLGIRVLGFRVRGWFRVLGVDFGAQGILAEPATVQVQKGFRVLFRVRGIPYCSNKGENQKEIHGPLLLVETLVLSRGTLGAVVERGPEGDHRLDSLP